MVCEMSYTTVSLVVDSWEMLRRVPDYQTVAGVKLFKIFFANEPAAAAVFTFGNDKVDDELFQSPRLIQHARYYMKMLDRAVNLLGPDIEMLTEILFDLGKTHVRFGVKPSMYPPMGYALIQTLQEVLGERFTAEAKDAWYEVYQALSYDMIRSNRANSLKHV